MTKQTVNIGTVADDGTGDPARTAFDKINDNFDEVYGVSGILKSNGTTTLSAAVAGTDYAAAAHTHTLTDVTDSGALAALNTVGTTEIDNGAVTYGKMQDVSVTSRFLGRITAGAGSPEELTGTQATTLLDVFTSGLQGLVPASGGGTTNFMRADGTWATPAGGGDVSKVGTPVDNQVAVWTGDGPIEGNASLTWDGVELAVPQINLGGVILDGTELADPGADRLVGWDDSAVAGSEPTYFQLGTGLGFDATPAVVLTGVVAINAQIGTTYTLVLADAGKIVSMDNGSANTLTIPTNAAVAFAVGTVINVTQLGAGQTTVQGDTGVTVNGASAGSEAISAQFKSVSLVKHATNTWVVEGATA